MLESKRLMQIAVQRHTEEVLERAMLIYRAAPMGSMLKIMDSLQAINNEVACVELMARKESQNG